MLLDLNELPHMGPSVQIAAVTTAGTSPQRISDLEFNPLGATTRTVGTIVWLVRRQRIIYTIYHDFGRSGNRLKSDRGLMRYSATVRRCSFVTLIDIGFQHGHVDD